MNPSYSFCRNFPSFAVASPDGFLRIMWKTKADVAANDNPIQPHHMLDIHARHMADLFVKNAIAVNVVTQNQAELAKHLEAIQAIIDHMKGKAK